MEAQTAQRTIPLKLSHVLIAVAVLGAAATLFFFNPASGGFYPRCMLKATTGLDCPGCGGLRAAHQLLHGNVAAAFDHNPLLLILLPIAGVGAVIYRLGRKRGWKVSSARVASPALWMLLVLAIVFTVLRNLPFPALAWMSS